MCDNPRSYCDATQSYCDATQSYCDATKSYCDATKGYCGGRYKESPGHPKHVAYSLADLVCHVMWLV